jgi:hypothetical protein
MPIEDLLWLPTEREMAHEGRARLVSIYGPYSASYDETATNQARLEYYSGSNDTDPTVSHIESNGKRIKHGAGTSYWEASPSAAGASSFCNVDDFGYTYNYSASALGGCAPAFCVR